MMTIPFTINLSRAGNEHTNIDEQLTSRGNEHTNTIPFTITLSRGNGAVPPPPPPRTSEELECHTQRLELRRANIRRRTERSEHKKRRSSTVRGGSDSTGRSKSGSSGNKTSTRDPVSRSRSERNTHKDKHDANKEERRNRSVDIDTRQKRASRSCAAGPSPIAASGSSERHRREQQVGKLSRASRRERRAPVVAERGSGRTPSGGRRISRRDTLERSARPPAASSARARLQNPVQSLRRPYQ